MVNLSVKRERFVQAYVGGMNATQAYIKAGYSESGAAPNAVRLIRNDNVKLRIKELQDDLRGQTMISLQTIVEELINDRTTARRLSNINASIKANVELAKLHGLYDQNNCYKSPYQHMSDDELDKEITKMEAKRAKKIKLVNNRAIHAIKK